MAPRHAGTLAIVVIFAGCRCSAANQPASVGGTAEPLLDASLDAAVNASDARAESDAAPIEDGWTVTAIVVDEAGAYWFADARRLMTQKPSGEGAPVSFATADAQPSALALDAKRVYWIEEGQLVGTGRADGAKKVIAKLARPRGLVLDGRSALVVADEADDRSAVFRVPLDGGPPKKIAAAPVGAMTLAADAASIFVITDEVLRIPRSGGAAKKISDSPEVAKEIVLIRDDIVFVGMDPQAMTGRVWSIPKRGPAPAPKQAQDDLSMVMFAGAVPVSGEEGSVVTLATDGRRPFWTTAPDDAAVKTAALQMPSAKGADEPVELAKVPSTTGLAVFRSRLYWASPTGVKSIPLPDSAR
jgi:hypothetical protein